jgi:amino acid transporter
VAEDIGEVAIERTHEVEARSKVFRKELGFWDLALTQILYVVGSFWVGTAAKLGDSHVIFWLAAVALFYLPQAAVVIYLNRLMPLEGGLYQWARVGLGEFTGFLTAWNLWAYAVVVMATFGVIIANNFSYLLGSMVSFTSASWYTPVASTTALILITFVVLFGLRVGKWLQNIGGIAQILTFGSLILVPFFALHRGAIDSYHPLKTSLPTFTPLTLNIFGKMAMGALSGFEYVAILAGECKNPGRTIGRSVLLAVPIIACMFIFGTSSVLALVPQKSIDLVSPIPQTLTIGFQGLSWAKFIVPFLILMLLLRQIGNVTLIFAGNTRLPMVAGWDGLLPRWFTNIHPRFRTPYHSILFVGVLILALTLLGQVGVGVQEAFQLLDNASGILYGFTYLGMFAIPIVASSAFGQRPPVWLRLAAVAGFGTSLLYCVLSIFPIIDVKNWHSFTLKIVVVLALVQLIGIGIYLLEKKNRQDAKAAR